MLHVLTLLAFGSAPECVPAYDAHVSDVSAGPCLEAVLADDVVTITSTCGPGTLHGPGVDGTAVHIQESATLAYDLASIEGEVDVDLRYEFVPDDGGTPEELVVAILAPGDCEASRGCDHTAVTPGIGAALALALLLRRSTACST